MIDEKWEKIIGYEDYFISNYGNVKSSKRDKEYILKYYVNIDGYYTVTLYNDSRRRVRVHRLVAEAFIENPLNLPIINHIDGNKQNNNVSNLEWSTVSENTQHAWDTGLIDKDKFMESRKKMMKPVYQINKNTGEVVNEFESYRDVIKKLNINKGNLNVALKNHKVCEGYIWVYKEEYDISKDYRILDRIFKASKDGVNVEFSNITEFSRQHKLDPSTVSKCIKGKVKTHHGWTFVEII